MSAPSPSSPASDGPQIIHPSHTSPGPDDTAEPSVSSEKSEKAISLENKGRRKHTKSRNGCRTCKKRKVKCDEVKPECNKCVRFGVSCDFKPLPSPEDSSQATPPRGVSRRGRPRKDWRGWLLGLGTSEANDSPTSQASLDEAIYGFPQPSSPPSLNIDELELFHHYCTNTAVTAGSAKIWRDQAPILGFEYPCILHAMLALSAHHLARLRPLRAPKYLLSADRHYELAVKGATQMLPSLNVENCQALYVVTVLVCFTAFAKGPSPGDLMVLSTADKVPWLALLRGVRMILTTMGTEVVLSGILDPHSDDSSSDSRPRHDLVGQNVVYWERSLERLSGLITATEGPGQAQVYMSQITTLAVFFKETYGTEIEPKMPPEGEFSHIMGWLYRMEPDFIETLEERQPIALLILGHFAVLVQALEHHWFIERWGAHMVREIKGMVGPVFEAWLL